jgi:hypothetical protein
MLTENQKTQRQSKFRRIKKGNKFFFFLSIFFFIFNISIFGSLSFSVGAGVERINETAPFLTTQLKTEYLFFDNDFTYLHEFGIIDTLGFSLKLDNELSPSLGISTAFGYNNTGDFFFEKDGIMLNAGIMYSNDVYTLLLKIGEYITFEGEMGQMPTIKFSCSIKIGEW